MSGCTSVLTYSSFSLICVLLQVLAEILFHNNTHILKDGNPDTTSEKVRLVILNLLVSTLFAGCVEESCKFVMARLGRHNHPTIATVRGFMFYAIAGAMGFSVIENICESRCFAACLVWLVQQCCSLGFASCPCCCACI